MNVVELISRWVVKLMGCFIFLPPSLKECGRKRNPILVGLTVKKELFFLFSVSLSGVEAELFFL